MRTSGAVAHIRNQIPTPQEMGMEQICLVHPMHPGRHDDPPALIEMGLTDERELDELLCRRTKAFRGS